MGISFSIPCDPCINKLFHGIEEKVDYTRNLEKNLVALTTTMEELRAKRDDLLRRITREEDRGQRRLARVNVWLTKIVNIESRVDDLFTNRDVELQRLCLCGFCSKSSKLSYRYGKSVLLTLREAEELKNEVYKVIAERGQIEVQERQLQPIIVGQATMLDKAWKHLKEDEVGITGMYGMGGVGKTTLLKQINNKFREERCGFDFVIWVVVSKELHIEKIQDEIALKVGLGGEEWKQKQESQKTDAIFNFLRKKKFVLFLDDLWEKVDLTEIGVPFPTTQNGCKVAFTTRSQDVCAHMGIEDPVEVQCLGENDAFDLFQRKVGKITLRSDPEIPNLARIVARKCSGLPLALNVIGETMSCKRTVQEWRHAIDVLTSYAAEFSGMEDKILPLLKYSYDNIKEEHYKSCLLYCSLFPEDYSIPKERLIEYLICEGIVDGSRSIERAENKGYEIIGGLVRASLLMEGVDECGRAVSVFMHDVVREMALWIATDLGIEKEAYIVRAGVGLDEMPKVKNWNVVKKMSLMNNKILRLAGSPQCLELTTLLFKNNSLKNISSVFFQYMPKLAVLDLSYNGRISELPDEISELVSLRYLDLSYTGIRYLPRRLLVLKNLIHLDLEYTRSLSSIDGISMVRNLKVLKLTESGFTWDLNTMKELVNLEHLEALSTGFNLPQPMKQFLCSPKLTSCTQYLRIWDSDMESSGISLPVTMDKLRDFIIQNCTISEIKMGTICSKSNTCSPLQNPRNTFLSLTTVRIRGCERLRELTLLMFASNLKVLTVGFANRLEDIINREKASRGEASGIVPFPNLINLTLDILPKLKSIYWRPLPLPCLKQIDVHKCPNLKKLPLDFHSGMHGGENGLVIRYREKEWIESVEWEDEATETHFLSSCKKI